MIDTQPPPNRTVCLSTDAKLCTRVAQIAGQGAEAVNRRLAKLDAEWTVGLWARVICGAALIIGITLAFAFSPWWLVLVAISGAALGQYLFFRRSVMGWLLAAAGVRSHAEIDEERVAFRTLRGDFQNQTRLGEVSAVN